MRDLPELHKLIKQLNKCKFTGYLLAVDPGHTTGVSVFYHDDEKTQLVYADQPKTWPFESAPAEFTRILDAYPNIGFCVYEAYNIYDWKLEQHSFSEVPTIQVIGCLKTLLCQRKIPFAWHSAQIGKGFCSDRKLEVWNLWLPALVHARDSIRHGCHYLLFGGRDVNSRSGN